MASESALEIGSRYSKADLAKLLDEPNLASVREGIFYRQGSPETLLFVDLEKEGKADRFHFNDYFDGEYFHWDSQTTQHIDSPKIVEIVEGRVVVHLFVRRFQKIKSKTQPFVYCGLVEYESHLEDTAKPVHIVFRNLDYDDFTENDDLIQLYLWKPDVSGKQTSNPSGRKEPSKKRRGRYKKPNKTERTGLVTSRVGQGWYRREVIEKWRGRCAVTGCDLKQILIASHIVRWSECSDHERLDPENGILLSPNVDSLFDRHLISFDDDGRLLVSDLVSEESLRMLGVSEGTKISLTDGMRAYLARHRERALGQLRIV